MAVVCLFPECGVVRPRWLNRTYGLEILRKIIKELADCLWGLRNLLYRGLFHHHQVHA